MKKRFSPTDLNITQDIIISRINTLSVNDKSIFFKNVFNISEDKIDYFSNLLSFYHGSPTKFLNSYEKSLWPIERNYTLNEEDIEKIINKYFSNCVWVSKIDNIFTEKKLVLKNSDIISVLDQYKNEISFPKEITSSDCIIIHDTSDCTIIQDTSYWYKITININIDYELESLEQ